MILSHVLSDAVLAAVGFGVFIWSFQRVPFFSRLLWGFFFATISLAALIGVFRFAGYVVLEPIHRSLSLLASSLGVVCVVMAVGSAVLQRAATQRTFLLTALLGLALFVALLLSPQLGAFTPVVSSLGMLVVMVLAVFGLRQRLRWAVWIVLSVMLMALATKADSLPIPLHPTDTYHYLLAAGLLCFGKAGKAIS